MNIYIDHSYAQLQRSKLLKLCALNVNGLFGKNKYGVFELYMQNFDIMCLTETKTDFIPDNKFSGYRPITLTNNCTEKTLYSTFVPRELKLEQGYNDKKSGEHFIIQNQRFGQNNSPSSGSIKKQ